MINITDKYNCCGCEACVQSCPKKCIAFTPDEEGFWYPQVVKKNCIDCSLCEKVCPVLNNYEAHDPLASYAAINDNEEERMKSSSGGIFILLARQTISEGGVVFGAKFDEEWNVVHSYAETFDDLKPFMGSKYVQSRIGNSYSQVKSYLKNGRPVLFSGTPCQIAGLRKFLQRDYVNLLTVDVFCHGVPSPMVWQDYLGEIKQNGCKGENNNLSPRVSAILEGGSFVEDNLKIESISFRNKKLGWKKYSLAFTLINASDNGMRNSVSLSNMFRDDPYMKLFLFNLSLRPSCYHCPVKEGRSGSDITLSDFWGIDKYKPNIDTYKGVSAVMTNTEKGKLFFSKILAETTPVPFVTIKANNTAYYRSSYRHPKRECFFRRKDLTISERAEKYAKLPMKKKMVVRFLISVSHIKSIIKNIIKK